MKRDFTEEAKTTLFGLIDEVNGGQWFDFTDWIGDIFIFADIQDYLNDVNAYHKKILDKNNTTKEQINTIFNNVNAVDQTYASTFSSYNQDVQEQIDYIKALADCINPANVLFKSVDSIKRRMDSVHLSFVENNSFVKTYGFTYEQYVLIQTAFRKLETYYEGDKQYINKVFNVLAPLCTRYNAKRWRLTTNGIDRVAAIKVLKEAGLTDQEITDLFVIINVQHGTTVAKLMKNDLGDIEDLDIHISQSNYLDMEPDPSLDYKKEIDGKEIKNDFAHQLIQIAEFSKKNTRPGIFSPQFNTSFFVEIFNFGYTDYEISFKGDIDSTRWTTSDFLSDIDSHNIYKRLSEKTHLLDTFSDYYDGVYDGETLRMTEFLENLGGGNADEGLNNIKSILDTWTPGSEHISRENPADKIKEGKEYFLKLVQDKYEAESNMHLKSHSKRNIQGEV